MHNLSTVELVRALKWVLRRRMELPKRWEQMQKSRRDISHAAFELAEHALIDSEAGFTAELHRRRLAMH